MCVLICLCNVNGTIVKTSRVISKLSANAVGSYLVEAISTDISPLPITIDLHNTTVDSRSSKQTKTCPKFQLVIPKCSFSFKEVVKLISFTYYHASPILAHAYNVCAIMCMIFITTSKCNISFISAVTAVNNCSQKYSHCSIARNELDEH